MRKRSFGILLAGIMLAGLKVSVYAAEVTHIYELDGNTLDAFGGPEIVLRNPAGLGAEGYTFGPGEGPSLRNAIDPSDYSIEILFRIDNTTGHKKLLDFKNGASNDGIYNDDTVLETFGSDGLAGAIFVGSNIHLVVTRDINTTIFTSYVNGVKQTAFLDFQGIAVFTGPDNIINFLIDENASDSQQPVGFLPRVRIYKGALTEAQVIDLFQGGIPPGLPATCAGLQATIVGTVDDDLLIGSAGNDIIAGLGGNDTIYGFGGNDIICGEDGDDVIHGGDGDDTLYGDAGNDVLRGNAGNDHLEGGGGNDSLDGDIGFDFLFGDLGNDTLAGGADDDSLNGGPDSDVCSAGGDAGDTINECEAAS